MLEKRGGLEKGCFRREVTGKRRGVLEKTGGLEKGCVRKEGRVREGAC